VSPEASIAGRQRRTPAGRLKEALRKRRHDLWKKFALIPEQYEAASERQGGVCSICKKKCQTNERLAVDHDHATGHYRGLLCRKCNNALGLFSDSPEILRRAADYLESGGSADFCFVTFTKLMEERWTRN
jgi:hypothetical protein